MPEKRTVIWGMLGGCVVIFLACTALVLRLPPPPVAKSGAAQSSSEPLGLLDPSKMSQDSYLDEQYKLLDPTPLFLPGAHNYLPQIDPSSVGSEDRLALTASYPDRLTFDTGKLPGILMDDLPVADYTQIEQVFQVSRRRTNYQAFGYQKQNVKSLTSRGAALQVSSLSKKGFTLTFPVPPKQVPATDTSLWEPLSFMIQVTADGMLHALGVAVSEGNVEKEYFWRDYLEKNIRIGALLPAGTYRVEVGP